MSPQTAAFAGMHAHGNVLEGSMEITGTATTTLGAEPAAAAPTPLPPLGTDVTEPGRFEIVLPIDIDYDAVRSKIQELATAMNDVGGSLRDITVRPFAGKIVIGLRIANAETADKDGEWVYLNGHAAARRRKADHRISRNLHFDIPTSRRDAGGRVAQRRQLRAELCGSNCRSATRPNLIKWSDRSMRV